MGLTLPSMSKMIDGLVARNMVTTPNGSWRPPPGDPGSYCSWPAPPCNRPYEATAARLAERLAVAAVIRAPHHPEGNADFGIGLWVQLERPRLSLGK